MARDRSIEPVTDEDWEAFQRAMDEQREEILEALAEDLGGDPEDYRVGTRRSVDAGEEPRFSDCYLVRSGRSSAHPDTNDLTAALDPTRRTPR